MLLFKAVTDTVLLQTKYSIENSLCKNMYEKVICSDYKNNCKYWRQGSSNGERNIRIIIFLGLDKNISFDKNILINDLKYSDFFKSDIDLKK